MPTLTGPCDLTCTFGKLVCDEHDGHAATANSMLAAVQEHIDAGRMQLEEVVAALHRHDRPALLQHAIALEEHMQTLREAAQRPWLREFWGT